MKRSVFALPLMLLSAIPVSAAPYTVYDYDPAYLDQPYRRAPRHSQARSNRDVYVNNQDTNSCLEGSVIGGLLGAGLGAVLSIVIVSAIISTIRIILPLMREDTSIVLWSEVRRTLGAYVDLFASTTGVPVKWAPTMVPSSLGFYGSLSQIINFSAPSMF